MQFVDFYFNNSVANYTLFGFISVESFENEQNSISF